jgi:excisionase family DNA binding protein
MTDHEVQRSQLIATEKLLRKKEVASRLACSERMVERLVASGKLTAVKIRGAVRFRLSDIEQIVMKGVAA